MLWCVFVYLDVFVGLTVCALFICAVGVRWLLTTTPHLSGMGFRINDIFSMYLRHNDINDYLDYLQLTYPNFVTVTTAGQSYEGRPLKLIKISWTDPKPIKVLAHRIKSSKKRSLSSIKFQSTEKAVILIDGGIHAREWISIATALYCIYELTELLMSNTNLLSKLDFVIVPVVNVDGYEFTHTKVNLYFIFFYNFPFLVKLTIS